MHCRFCLAIVGLAAVTISLAFTQAPQDNKPASKPPAAAPKPKDAPPAGDMQLPPGWTQADVDACTAAATQSHQSPPTLLPSISSPHTNPNNRLPH